MRVMTLATSVFGLVALTGCAQIKLIDKSLNYLDLSGKVKDAEGVAVEMPTGGTATYDGVVGIGANYGDGAVALAGDAALTANFGAKTISGTLDNFIAAEVDGDVTPLEFMANPVDSIYTFETADGTIDVTGGTITGSGFNADFDGAILVNGKRYVAVGNMDGVFMGPNGELIEATASGANIDVTRDGSHASNAHLYLVAED